MHWALEHDVPIPVISDAQHELMAFRDQDRVQAEAVALLRYGFGGHPVHRVDGDDG